MQSWNLMAIDAPDGDARSRSSLHSDNEARAVLIGSNPGQELGDHQVKEHAWVAVLDGSVRVAAGGESVEAGAGYAVRFAPDERHAVSSDERRADPAPARALARRGPLPRQRRPASATWSALAVPVCASRRWYERQISVSMK